MFLQSFSELSPGILVTGEFFSQAQGKLQRKSMAFNFSFYLTGSCYFFPGDIGFVVGIFNFGRNTMFFFLGFPVEGFKPFFCNRIIVSDLP
jgi:hypothetical protein